MNSRRDQIILELATIVKNITPRKAIRGWRLLHKVWTQVPFDFWKCIHDRLREVSLDPWHEFQTLTPCGWLAQRDERLHRALKSKRIRVIRCGGHARRIEGMDFYFYKDGSVEIVAHWADTADEEEAWRAIEW